MSHTWQTIHRCAAGLTLAAAACSVDYRPGTVRTDTAQGDATAAPAADTAARTAALAHPAPATAAPPAASATPATPAAPGAALPDDSLEALGDAPPPTRARTFPRTAADSSPPTGPEDVTALRGRAPIVPVQGVPATALRDNFTDLRGGGTRPHEALDIMAPRGTPVLAADDGRVVKLFLSKAGGLTIYVASPDGRYMFYYAHLDRYRDGLTEGTAVRKGEPIAFVGSTGDASPDAPHLHFAIARVADPAWWWTGTPIDPFPVLRP